MPLLYVIMNCCLNSAPCEMCLLHLLLHSSMCNWSCLFSFVLVGSIGWLFLWYCCSDSESTAFWLMSLTHQDFMFCEKISGASILAHNFYWVTANEMFILLFSVFIVSSCCLRHVSFGSWVAWTLIIMIITRGQSNLTKSASLGAHSPVRGHPRGSKVVPLNSWGRVSY